MFDKKIKDFRNKIVNDAINKLNKNDLEINSRNNNYLSILDNFIKNGSSTENINKNELYDKSANIKKVNYYLNKLNTQKNFFGGSLKLNNKTSIKTYKDKEYEINNMLVCLDDDYKDSLFCAKSNDFKNLNYYKQKLVSIFEYLNVLKRNNINDPIFKFLLMEKDKKYKDEFFSSYTTKFMDSMPIESRNIYKWEEYINKYNFDKIYHDNELIYTSNYFFMDHIINICNVNKYNNNIHVLPQLKIFLNSKNIVDNKIVLELINSDNYLINDSKIDVNLKTKEQKICAKEIINSFDLNQNFNKLKENIKLISIGYIFFKDILNGIDKIIKTNSSYSSSNSSSNIDNMINLKSKIQNDLNKINELNKYSDKKEKEVKEVSEYIDAQKDTYINAINLINKKINKYRIYDENKYLISKINNYNKILTSFLSYIDSDEFNFIDFNMKISLFFTKIYTNYTNFSSNFKVHHSLIKTINELCKLNRSEHLVSIPKLEQNKYNIGNYFTNSDISSNIMQNKYSLIPIYIYIQNSNNISFVNTNHLVMLIKNNKLEYNYNTDKTDNVKDNLECTLFLLKGDGKYEVQEKENYKLFETNLFYDYHCMQENYDIKDKDISFYLINSLISNFKKNSTFNSMNISIKNSYVSKNRIINFYKLRNLFDEKLNDKTNFKISESNLSKINLIKTDYFYIENFYECLFTILNSTEKSMYTEYTKSSELKQKNYLDFKTYIENFLKKNNILDNFDIEKKINKLKSKDNSDIELNLNKYVSKYFNENKDYYKKYIDLLKIVSIYCNSFINQLNNKDISTIIGKDFDNHSYLFKSKLYFNFIINELNKDKDSIDKIIKSNYTQIVS